MASRGSRRFARGGTWIAARAVALFAVAGAFALGGCDQNGGTDLSAAQPRGASVSFVSIDGPPAGEFHKLVRDLNVAADSRRLAVIPRGQAAAYRVRGYLAANVDGDHTTIAWVWDVFGADEQRALRVSGEESVPGRGAWSAMDDAMVRRIADGSMTQLAAFLTSRKTVPGAPAEPETPDAADLPQVAFAPTRDASPEAAGIFRIDQGRPAGAPADRAAAVPLPPHRPTPAAAVSARYSVTLSAESR